MYNSVFGFGSNEFESEMDTWTPSIDQYDEGLTEVPIEKPYEFCDNIKNSGGEESKIMDFKTGIFTITKEQPLLPSSFSMVCSWQSIQEHLWVTTFLHKL